MSQFKFIPNEFAKKMFNLSARSYAGEGMTPLLQQVLGSENYNKYVIAQDPLCGGKSEGAISIILNNNERDPKKMNFASIGLIQKTEQLTHEEMLRKIENASAKGQPFKPMRSIRFKAGPK